MSLVRRIEALERRSTGCPMISSIEVIGIKSQLRSKLGLSPVKTVEIPAPIARRAVEKAGGKRTRICLARHFARAGRRRF
jgi:hypothetical protein